VRWLVCLYPAGWRRRYGAELRTVLAGERPTVRGVLDVLLGALDAHLHSELWRPQPAFERLSEPGRRALALAQEEARRLRHGYLGTEHVLLGLLREPDGAAARLLADLGVGLDNVRARVEAIVGMGAADLASGRCRRPAAAGGLRFAPRSKRVLQRAAEEADRRHHARVGDVHLLLGIVAEKEGVAAGVLAQVGVVNSPAFQARIAAALGEEPAP
jgi:ATP-dependent Clp protease ATP-binding subunit ClpC